MANKKSLTPYKKGQSGNPNGRPQGSLNRKTLAKWVLARSAKDVLPEVIYSNLTEKYPELDKMSIEEVMHLIQIGKAVEKGDTLAYTAVMDSGYGKATQDITTDGESLNLGFYALLKETSEYDDTGESE